MSQIKYLLYDVSYNFLNDVPFFKDYIYYLREGERACGCSHKPGEGQRQRERDLKQTPRRAPSGCRSDNPDSPT